MNRNRALVFLGGILLGAALGWLFAPSPRPLPPSAPGVSPAPAVEPAAPDPELVRLREEVARLKAAATRIADAPAPAESAPAPLPPGDGYTVLRVRVVDGEGMPRPGVRVYTKLEEEAQAQTDGDGVAEFRGVTPGRRWISASLGGLSSGNRFEVAAGRTTEVPITLATGACAVEGIVRHRDRGPVAKVSVGLYLLERGDQTTRRAETDAEGRYRFDGVAAGAYHVSAYGTWREGETPYSVLKRIEVAPGSTTVADIVAGNRSLFGSVRDAETGAPVAGARVSIQEGTSRDATTDTQGGYVLYDVMAGSVTLLVSADGYGIEFLRGVEVTEGETRRDVPLRPAATLLLAIADAAGQPVSGRVHLGIRPKVEGEGTRVGTSVTADENGRAAYRQVLPGSYTIRFMVEGRGERTLDVEIVPGENAVEVKLP